MVMCPATSPRRHKRRFQPSIKSYFARPDEHESTPTATTSPLVPLLPSDIQSSLLNVGMRVRKSVPEGYQTPYKTEVREVNCVDAHMSAQAQTFKPASALVNGYSGLAPYCGINKIGSYASQSVDGEGEELLPPLSFDDGEDGFPSSQESHASSLAINPSLTYTPVYALPAAILHSRKRPLENTGDFELSAEAEDNDAADFLAPGSPRGVSYPVSHTRMPNLNILRPIIQPKSRRKGKGGLVGDGTGKEMKDVGDFEEAEFFRPEEWMGEDPEGMIS